MNPSGANYLPAERPCQRSMIFASTLVIQQRFTLVRPSFAHRHAQIATLPLDTAKVLLQVQKASATPKYKGLLGTCLCVFFFEV